MWFALDALKNFRSMQFKHNGLVVVPGEAQLDWPVDQLFPEQLGELRVCVDGQEF